MLPNFVVIGAPKAGSTSLYYHLRSHPEVFMPAEKEPEFFLESVNWHRGIDWYERQFDQADGALAIGEASVRYTTHPLRPGVPKRMARTLPGARLIYLVREPVARMVSQWVHNFRIGAERDPLWLALRKPRYLLLSSYAYQAERFLEHFPREQLLVLTSERLRADPGAALDRVCRHLGVSEGFRPPTLGQEFNATSGHLMPRPRTRKLLALRGAGRVRRATPGPIRRAVASATHTPAVTPQLPASLVEELHGRLADDVRRLRTYVEPPFDGWGIA